MKRVLVTGGAGTIGAAVVRRLLRDPDYEVRVSDGRDAPALDEDVTRFVYVSSSAVFERAHEFPTPESHLADCPFPLSPRGFSKLTVAELARLCGEACGNDPGELELSPGPGAEVARQWPSAEKAEQLTAA